MPTDFPKPNGMLPLGFWVDIRVFITTIQSKRRFSLWGIASEL